MKQRFVALDAVEITVLDEADHMADLGFLPGRHAHPGRDARTAASACCSRATLDNGVDKLVKRFLHNEVLHSVDEANSPRRRDDAPRLRGRRRSTPRRTLVQTLASGTGRRILFMRTKHQAKKLAKQLTEAGIPAVDLHGNLSQAAARPQPRRVLRRGAPRVLVATDVAARGVARRRRRARRARRPARRAQGVPAPLRPHRPRRLRGRRRDRRAARASARTVASCCARPRSRSRPSA